MEIPSATEKTPVFMQCLRVTAYCRVSTEQEEQRGSLEAQELYYSHMISRNPFWTNAGVFSERVSGLNAKERSKFQARKQIKNQGGLAKVLIENHHPAIVSRELFQAVSSITQRDQDVYPLRTDQHRGNNDVFCKTYYMLTF